MTSFTRVFAKVKFMDAVTPMNDISALQVPGGNLNWNVLSLLFQKPIAFPAVADFIVVDLEGTLKFPCCHQLKCKR